MGMHNFTIPLAMGLFVYFWLCWSFLLTWAFSRCDEQGLLSSCGAPSSHCCGTQALDRAQRLQQLTVHGLSCPAACGIFPNQGSNPCPHIGRWILNHQTTKKVPIFYLFKHCLSSYLFLLLSENYNILKPERSIDKCILFCLLFMVAYFLLYFMIYFCENIRQGFSPVHQYIPIIQNND